MLKDRASGNKRGLNSIRYRCAQGTFGWSKTWQGERCRACEVLKAKLGSLDFL